MANATTAIVFPLTRKASGANSAVPPLTAVAARLRATTTFSIGAPRRLDAARQHPRHRQARQCHAEGNPGDHLAGVANTRPDPGAEDRRHHGEPESARQDDAPDDQRRLVGGHARRGSLFAHLSGTLIGGHHAPSVFKSSEAAGSMPQLGSGDGRPNQCGGDARRGSEVMDARALEKSWSRVRRLAGRVTASFTP